MYRIEALYCLKEYESVGCNIYVNKKLVIDCSAGTLEIMYDIIDEFSYENHFNKNNDFLKFLHEMNIAVKSMCSYGFDFIEHIEHSNTVELLIFILNKCSHKFKLEFSDRLYEDIVSLEKELIKYSNFLKSQGR
jgi:hypothetical protein